MSIIFFPASNASSIITEAKNVKNNSFLPIVYSLGIFFLKSLCFFSIILPFSPLPYSSAIKHLYSELKNLNTVDLPDELVPSNNIIDFELLSVEDPAF